MLVSNSICAPRELRKTKPNSVYTKTTKLVLLARSFLACFTNGLKARNTCLVKCYCGNIYIYIHN